MFITKAKSDQNTKWRFLTRSYLTSPFPKSERDSTSTSFSPALRAFKVTSAELEAEESETITMKNSRKKIFRFLIKLSLICAKKFKFKKTH